MRQIILILSFSMANFAMETPQHHTPASAQSFAQHVYQIKKAFEQIKTICSQPTEYSMKNVDTLVAQLQTQPDQDLVSLLWEKHYHFSTADLFVVRDASIAQDMAILTNNRLKELLGSDQECLSKAQARVLKIQKLHCALWHKIGAITFAKPAQYSSIHCTTFLALQKKLDSLFNYVFATNDQALPLIESIYKDTLNSQYSVFLTILWDPRITKAASLGTKCTGYNLDQTIKQKIDELHEKVNQIKDQP